MTPPLVRPSLAGDIDWMQQARCRDVAPHWELLDAIMFYEAGPAERATGEDSHATKMARRLCAACPVRSKCLRYALALEGSDYSHRHRDEGEDNSAPIPPWGVWGGTTEVERRSTRHLPTAERIKRLTAIAEEAARGVLLPGEAVA